MQLKSKSHFYIITVNIQKLKITKIFEIDIEQVKWSGIHVNMHLVKTAK
jgi:hypothetical protein